VSFTLAYFQYGSLYSTKEHVAKLGLGAHNTGPRFVGLEHHREFNRDDRDHGQREASEYLNVESSHEEIGDKSLWLMETSDLFHDPEMGLLCYLARMTSPLGAGSFRAAGIVAVSSSSLRLNVGEIGFMAPD
jgi:hypothetical protein